MSKNEASPIEPRHAEEAARLATRERLNHSGESQLSYGAQALARTLARHEAELAAKDAEIAKLEDLIRHESALTNARDTELAEMSAELLAHDEREKAMEAAIAEAVPLLAASPDGNVNWLADKFRPFLPTPQPDPLVEALGDIVDQGGFDSIPAYADCLREALARHGLEISKKGE